MKRFLLKLILISYALLSISGYAAKLQPRDGDWEHDGPFPFRLSGAVAQELQKELLIDVDIKAVKKVGQLGESLTYQVRGSIEFATWPTREMGPYWIDEIQFTIKRGNLSADGGVAEPDVYFLTLSAHSIENRDRFTIDLYSKDGVNFEGKFIFLGRHEARLGLFESMMAEPHAIYLKAQE